VYSLFIKDSSPQILQHYNSQNDKSACWLFSTFREQNKEESGKSHSTDVESCSSTAGRSASQGFQPPLLLEGPSTSAPTPLLHLSVELAQIFMQLSGVLEQGNVLIRKENSFERQFFISVEVTMCPYQQLCQLSGRNGTSVDVIRHGLGVRGKRRQDCLNLACC